MTLTYFVLVYVLVSAIAIATFIAIKPQKSAASNGQLTAQSLSEDINSLKEYRRSLSISNTVLLLLAALSATLLVVASRLSDESADDQSELQSQLDSLKEQRFTEDLTEKQGQIAELEKGGAILKAANLKLESEIAPRRLTDRQKKALSSLSPHTSFFSGFADRLVEIQSYSGDTEGLILATEMLNALTKSKINILDNRLTQGPSGSISFGVSVTGPDTQLVAELERILSIDGELTKPYSSVAAPNRGGSIGFMVSRSETPPGAIIFVGAKPIRLE